MTHRLTDKPSVVTVPFRQTVAKAGDIGSVTEDTSTWLPLENGLNIKDGKLALSTSSTTVVANAQTLYPQLWANTPSAWKSGSDLTIPAIQDQGYSEWIDVTTEMNSTGKPENTGIVGDGTYSYYYYRLGTKSLDVKFRWVGASAGSGTTNILIPLPSGQEFGFSGITTSISQNGLGSCLTVNIDHANPTTSNFANTSFNYNAGDEKLRIIKLGTTQGLRGDDLLVNSQLQGEVNVIIEQAINRSTPYIQLFDDVATNVIGLPDATSESKGLTTLNQVAEAGRNYIINGGMEIDQRHNFSSVVTGGVGANDFYSADRYYQRPSGSGAGGGAVQVITSDAPEGFTHSMRLIGTGALTGLITQQRIEASEVSSLVGKQVTFSFWFRTNNTGLVNSVNVYTYTPLDTSGPDKWNSNLTSDTIEDTTIFNIEDDSWKRYSVTFTVPANGANGLAVALDLPNVSGANVITTGWKLEEGSQATKFTRAGGTYAGELALCQRYYYKKANNSGGSNYGLFPLRYHSSTSLRGSFYLPVPLRKNPTITYSNIALESGATISVIGAGGTPNQYDNLNIIVVTSSPGSNPRDLLYYNHNGFIDFDAEL